MPSSRVEWPGSGKSCASTTQRKLMTPSARPILGSRWSRRPLQREWIHRVPPPLRCVRGHTPIAQARMSTPYPSSAHITKSQLRDPLRLRYVPLITMPSRHAKDLDSNLSRWTLLQATPRASGTTPGTSVRASVLRRWLRRAGLPQSGPTGRPHGQLGRPRLGQRTTANHHCTPLAAIPR